MADLTLKEALEQYEDECREVLTSDESGVNRYEAFVVAITHFQTLHGVWRQELIGACVEWLAGKEDEYMEYGYCYYPTRPLLHYLNEVRRHMQLEANND